MVGYYVWPSVLMWAVDRVLRALRNIVYNLGYFGAGKRVSTLDASVEVLASDFVRVTLRRPDHIHWTPGQCAYLTIPGLSTFDAHPFTISTIDAPPRSKKSLNHFDKEKSIDPFDESKKLTFLIRVHKGFTKLVRNAVQDDESMKIFFDGPYGEPPLLKGFETVILIASAYHIQH
jgi:ferric-chelate reductase